MSTHLPIAPEQAELVEALESGRATGDPRPLRRVDTHMSHLFLGPDRAYKLKRSLRHPFADASSLEARRRLCQAELEVNKPLAPALYLDMTPLVRRPDGALRLGGEGEVCDWLVVMRRFPDGALLDEIAERGGLTDALVTETAEVVANFHRSLRPHPVSGHAPDYHRIIAGLRATETQAAAAAGLASASEPLLAALKQELARQAPLIEARRRHGKTRRGHGDLHLRNICLFEGRVTPFDALEFDPQLATADVLYDAAFLFMDLCARGLTALANLAMNTYWDAAQEDEAALALLPFFTALRAAVRMAVAVQAQNLAEAARYRDLGARLLHGRHPSLVAIGGLSGTGKSTLAKALAPSLPGPCGARILRSDVIRKAAGPLPADAYTPETRGSVYDLLADRARAALHAQASVIADATFQDQAHRAEIERAAGEASFIGLWLRGSPAVRTARIEGRQGDASDATAAIALAQHEPSSLGPAWTVLNADQPLAPLLAEAQRVVENP